MRVYAFDLNVGDVICVNNGQAEILSIKGGWFRGYGLYLRLLVSRYGFELPVIVKPSQSVYCYLHG